ncbi:hypothetical protein VFPPC_16740 [Pochonia chlamydosporia 170]|uniref:Uncharacterized protein n=1 Tax=Pochonia chlamydosporia 170 TaxID=1380566 RepID=A0A179F5A6_METCM|nr:hypothetical protein VFPPC_16740 [Pochonia chlamydosporia 170]OAQ60550.1 hypothetical protein VFPPC_16740 [Pochonia chlamydosporia 170]
MFLSPRKMAQRSFFNTRHSMPKACEGYHSTSFGGHFADAVGHVVEPQLLGVATTRTTPISRPWFRYTFRSFDYLFN